MKKYPSKISYVLLIFILAVLTAGTIPMIFEPVWTGILINVGVTLFIIHLYLNTYYLIDGEFLIVKSGFIFNKKIEINSVKSIREANSILSAPALSFDRLEVNWGEHAGLVISPKEKKKFVAHVAKINPQIDLKMKKGQ